MGFENNIYQRRLPAGRDPFLAEILYNQRYLIILRRKNILLVGDLFMCDPPLPIPNREVKAHPLDDTWCKLTPGKVEFANLEYFLCGGF